MIKHFLAQIPIPMAGVSLGVAALGNLLQSISPLLRVFCGVLSFLLLALLLAKFMFCFPTVREDFRNPVIASVSATMFMAIMLLTTYVQPYAGTLSLLLWIVAVLAHMVLIAHYTIYFLFRFSLKDILPTCFVTYVGIVVASVTSVSFGLEAVGRAIFWFGFLAYIVMFILITCSHIKHKVHESLRPLFCIYTAPMSLTITGYLAVMEEKSLTMMLVMEGLAQLLYLVVLTQLPKLLKLQFYPSYAAFTFPFVITATALKQVIDHLSPFYTIPAWLYMNLILETIIATCLVGYTVLHYLAYLYRSWINSVQMALPESR